VSARVARLGRRLALRWAGLAALALLGLLGLLGACSRAGAVKPDVDVPDAAAPPSPPPAAAESVVVPAVEISSRVETTVHVAWDAPPGTAVNDEAPFHVRWTTSEGLAEVPPELRGKGREVSRGFDVRVVAARGAPEAGLAGTVDLVVCDEATHAVCVPVKRRLEMPFLVTDVADAAAARREVRVALPKAR
jgi:hypothetical protein